MHLLFFSFQIVSPAVDHLSSKKLQAEAQKGRKQAAAKKAKEKKVILYIIYCNYKFLILHF